MYEIIYLDDDDTKHLLINGTKEILAFLKKQQYTIISVKKSGQDSIFI